MMFALWEINIFRYLVYSLPTDHNWPASVRCSPDNPLILTDKFLDFMIIDT